MKTIISACSNHLKDWFLLQRRPLPWRIDPTPYAVWVSEVMLQQTQVAVVIPYFERWMARFPTISALAEADSDTVIKMWEGLGYYSRARNLHAGAKYVVEHFGGILPKDAEALSQIKGVGPYTVGAIRAFAFRQKAAAVDGNVMRVLARLYDMHEPIDQPKVVTRLRGLAEELLPEEEPWVVAEALIELGATVCGRRPSCECCPMRQVCQSYAKGTCEQLPKKAKRVAIQKLFRIVAIIQNAHGLLLRRCEEGEIMHDLHEFPYFDVESGGIDRAVVDASLPLSLVWQYDLSPVEHAFTRYRVQLTPMVFHCASTDSVAGYQWKRWEELPELAFSSGHRRILQAVIKQGITP